MPRPCAVEVQVCCYKNAARELRMPRPRAVEVHVSRATLVEYQALSVNHHGARPWHLEVERGWVIAVNVNDHGARPWHWLLLLAGTDRVMGSCSIQKCAS